MVVGVYLKDIETTRQQAAEYKPGLRDYYVQDFSDRENIYLKASLSPSRRQKWMGTWPANIVQCITPQLEVLAATAKKTLPSYTPGGYTLGTPAELKVLRTGVNDLDQATATMHLEMTEGTIDYHWVCTREGLVSYDFATSGLRP